MNKTWQLTKVLLKNGSGIWGGRTKDGWKRAVLLLLVCVGLVPMLSAYVMLTSALYDGLKLAGQETVLLGLGMAAACLGIFVLGIFYVLSVFFYSQDVEHLLPLPLKPAHIIGAKFLLTLLYEYMTMVILLGPLLITYGVKSDADALYYLYMLIAFLALPVIPVVLASLVAMLFMRFTNIGKSKDRFRLVGGLAAIAIAIGFQAFVQRGAKTIENAEQLQEMILSDKNLFLSLVTQMFPTSKLGAMALAEAGTLAGMGYLAAFLLVSAAFGAALIFLGDRLYFKGVMGISETAAKRKKASAEEFDRMTGKRSAFVAYAIKEWKMLFRTPAFLLNCVLSSFFLPLIAFLPLATRSDGLAGLAEYGAMLQSETAAGIGVAIAVAAAMFMTTTGSISVTAISREGQGFFVNRFLPVPASVIILAKVVPGTVLGIFSLLLLEVLAGVLLQAPVSFLLWAFLASVPGILFVNLLGIMIDLNMPKLDWDSEQKAVKQNMNTLIPLVIGLAVSGLIFFLVLQGDAAGSTVSGTVCGLFVIVDLILYRILMKKGPGWFEKIG
ncbi:putative ABC transporter permease subunit [Brevibacillus borstelensis]|uniref:putative ABC transporter permease subunit n=1 Tax=Brevibacillus borstelensis TaxID=45462 RepID=UPI0030BD5E44